MDSVLIDKRVTSVISDKNNLFSYRKIQPLLDKDEPIYLFFVRGLDERVVSEGAVKMPTSGFISIVTCRRVYLLGNTLWVLLKSMVIRLMLSLGF